MIRTQCVKIEALRKTYLEENIDLEKWMEKENSLYVGRKGRIFIKQLDGTKKIFHYKDSIWRNLFKVGPGKYDVDTSIRLYKKHIIESDLINRLGDLENKVLGCFCDQNDQCHAKILVELYKQRVIKEIIYTDQTIIICTGSFKNGKKCTYKAKKNGRCGKHPLY